MCLLIVDVAELVPAFITAILNIRFANPPPLPLQFYLGPSPLVGDFTELLVMAISETGVLGDLSIDCMKTGLWKCLIFLSSCSPDR